VVAGRATPNQGVNKCCRPSEIYFVSSTIFPVIPREIKSGRVKKKKKKTKKKKKKKKKLKKKKKKKNNQQTKNRKTNNKKKK
jgi:mannitol-specific phosphotransferase system IIBC component